MMEPVPAKLRQFLFKSMEKKSSYKLMISYMKLMISKNSGNTWNKCGGRIKDTGESFTMRQKGFLNYG